MSGFWCKVASNLDSHPKIRRAGRNGREVFLFALRRNAEPNHETPGALAFDDFEPWFIADQLMMSEPEALEGLERCEKAKLLRRKDNSFHIVGWSDGEWGRETSTERVQRFREKQKQEKRSNGSNETDETFRNVSGNKGNVSQRSRVSSETRETDETLRSEKIREDQNNVDGDLVATSPPMGGTGDAVLSDSDSDPGNGAPEPEKPRVAHASARSALRLDVPEPPLQALVVATSLMDYLVRNHPDSKLARATEPQRENTLAHWAHEIRLMVEVDKLPYERIQAAVHWCLRDPFWRGVIFSAKDLRKQWDKIIAQRSRPRTTAAGKEREPTPEEIAQRRARDDAESRASIARVAEMQRAAEADRPDVVAELARAKAALGIAPRAAPEPEVLDDDAEPEEDIADVG